MSASSGAIMLAGQLLIVVVVVVVEVVAVVVVVVVVGGDRQIFNLRYSQQQQQKQQQQQQQQQQGTLPSCAFGNDSLYIDAFCAHNAGALYCTLTASRRPHSLSRLVPLVRVETRRRSGDDG